MVRDQVRKLKSDFRYTHESVFETFPWPQTPTVAQIDAVAEAGRQVRRVRADALSKIEGGLRAVYRLLELPGKNPLKEAQALSTPPFWPPTASLPRKTSWLNCSRSTWKSPGAKRPANL